jgi:hypothetical protein
VDALVMFKRFDAQHSMHPTVGLAAFSGSLHGLELVLLKWRDLLPPRRIEPVEITRG